MRTAAAAVLLLVTAAGCGPGKPDLSPVHGTVFYQGTPLTCGTIVFTPDASRGHRGSLARGEIQPDGSYSLRSEDGYGVAAGWYRVTVLAVEMPDGPADGQRYAAPRSLLPEKYRDPDLAGLLREVRAGRANAIDFHLE